MAKKKKKIEVACTAEYLLDGIRADMKEDAASFTTLGDDLFTTKIRGVVSFRCPGINRAIGRGGAPLGRTTIIHSRESVGKTTLLLQLIAEVQKMGGVGVFYDKEYKLDPDYARLLGVDLDKMILSQPATLEGVIQSLKALISRVRMAREKTGIRRPVVAGIDSLNACKSKESVETVEGKRQYPAEARIWSEEFPEIARGLQREDIALVLLSQFRKKMNQSFGDDMEIAGGWAPKHYASVILRLSRISKLKNEGRVVGSNVEVVVNKNQIANPFQKAAFPLRFGSGTDYHASLLAEAELAGILQRLSKSTGKPSSGGKLWVIGKKKVFFGERDKLLRALRSKAEVRKPVRAALKEHFGFRL